MKRKRKDLEDERLWIIFLTKAQVSEKRRKSTGIWSFGKRAELEYESESLQHGNDGWDYKVDISYGYQSQDWSPRGQITFEGKFNDYEAAKEIKKAYPERVRKLRNFLGPKDKRIKRLVNHFGH